MRRRVLEQVFPQLLFPVTWRHVQEYFNNQQYHCEDLKPAKAVNLDFLL